jgi:hypothetical protein
VTFSNIWDIGWDDQGDWYIFVSKIYCPTRITVPLDTFDIFFEYSLAGVCIPWRSMGVTINIASVGIQAIA